ncbi:unnamed protein product [Urochloa humidicola]
MEESATRLRRPFRTDAIGVNLAGVKINDLDAVHSTMPASAACLLGVSYLLDACFPGFQKLLCSPLQHYCSITCVAAAKIERDQVKHLFRAVLTLFPPLHA